jgi:uncharacterized protein with von Willebrand factor type A (vWA) domain
MAGSNDFVRQAIAFGHALRQAGLTTTTVQTMDFVRAVEHIDIGRRSEFHGAARACLVSRKDDLATFDAVFDRFWLAPVFPDGLLDVKDLPPQVAPGDEFGDEQNNGSADSVIRRASEPTVRISLDEAGEIIEEDGSDQEPGSLSFSSAEVLRRKDFADLTDEELAEARRLMEKFEWRIGQRHSRRRTASTKGPFLDPRRTIRRSLQTGGVPLTISRRKIKLKPRQLVVICDVSGSMDRYSRLLLQFIYAIENGMARVEAFVFSTRLTRITRLLRRRSIDDAMGRVAGQVHDWSGGTRIGQSLRTFNVAWAPRILRNGAVVLIIGDGWDRGEPALLSREIARLQRSSYRLIWLNPLLGSPLYQPLTRGMQAALPHIDDFMPVHNLASLEALAAHFSAIDDCRPVRRQQRTTISPENHSAAGNVEATHAGHTSRNRAMATGG